ncbi:hypothetical protein QYM36_012529 [Artemia franciscana]|uniref:Nucleosome-remodeling factor subunit NURF301 n=1 Tax=Artemia franciscana TaxID=6661 RepID=A0AA88L7X7_ARTSF|nr:hypothetical protein QYM36_012529 [Artemia franciscana]
MSSRKTLSQNGQTPRSQKKGSVAKALGVAIPIEKPKWFKEREAIGTPASTKKVRTKKGKIKINSTRDSVSVLKTARTVTKRKSKKDPEYDEETEYHYGSDFDGENGEYQSSEDYESVESDEEFEEPDIVSDSLSSELFDGWQKPPTPLPYWLRDEEIYPLIIPETSHDLLLDPEISLKAAGIYEVLRRFSSIVRLSPFRFEDFLSAIQAEEFSNLIVEIHMMLLKALLREEELQQTVFGPIDLKDGINSMLYFMDAMTWPEVLHLYLQSDKMFQVPLDIVEKCNYPFTSVENRLEVIGFLVNQFLLTTPVREHLASDGNVIYEDHCRVCHRLGDLLCCETCPAVYHLACISPRIEGLPPDDWKCQVCLNHNKVKGVLDCVSDEEKAGLLIRHDNLGLDRHGRKYWFVCRRIFIEDIDGNVTYYSTRAQLAELLEALSHHEYETELYLSFATIRGEVERQMEITEQLTNTKKGDRRSYIEADNELVEQIKEERETKNRLQEAKDRAGEELKGEVLFEQQLGGEMEVVEEVVSSESHVEPENVAPKMKTPIEAPPSRWEQLKGLPLYRLGSENFFRGYKNQYTENPLALNKFQHQEEKDKKRHLSHKFSMTPVSDFKWSGAQFGTQSALMHTFRNTILHMQQNFLTAFCHYNWPMLRRNWVSQMAQAKEPSAFAKPLAFFSLIIKAAAYNSVWTDQLGITRLQRQTVLDREERKKQEKKEEKDKKLEEEINRTFTVHYTIPLKHQVHKQRGEEYRLHGRWGWQWLSNGRVCKRVDPYQLGHRGEPCKIVISMAVPGGEKFLSVDPKLLKLIQDHKAGIPVKEATQSQILDVLSKRVIKSVEYGTKVNRIINVCESLSSVSRSVYPKIAKKRKLDALLDLRMKLYEQEKLEKEEIEVKKEEEKIKEEKEAEERRLALKDEVYTKLNDLKDEFGEISGILKLHPCYVDKCRDGDKGECYSTLCLRLQAVQEEIENQEEMLQRIDVGEDVTQPLARKLTSSATFKQEAKEEKVDAFDEGFVDIEGTEVKKEELESVENVQDQRVYAPTAQPYSLKKPSQPTKRALDIPVCRFLTKSGKPSIFAIPRWEQRKVARTYGQFTPSGLNPNAKGNALAWPYPCFRPSFKMCWYYRTALIKTVSAAALQLRILWACLRWDEMSTKPPINDLKQIRTTETDVITVEYLSMRTTGHYKERTEYLKRTVIIPLDHNRKKNKEVDLTPARSGLRKRKKVETPEITEPSSTEEWIDETQMELWEIRLYYDKHIAKRHQSELSSMQRAKQLAASKSQTANALALKLTTEEGIRQQRLAMKAGTTGISKITPLSGGMSSVTTMSPKTALPNILKTHAQISEVPTLQIRHQQGTNRFEISGIRAGQRVVVRGDTVELQSTDSAGKPPGVLTQIKIEGLSKIPNPVFVAAPSKPVPSRPTTLVTYPRFPGGRLGRPPAFSRIAPGSTPSTIVTNVNGLGTDSIPSSVGGNSTEKPQNGGIQLAIINGQNVVVEKKGPTPSVQPSSEPLGVAQVEKYEPPYVILSQIQPGGKASLTYKDIRPNVISPQVVAHIQTRAKQHLSAISRNVAKGIQPPARIIIPIPGYTPGTSAHIPTIPASQIAVNPAAVTGQMPVRAPSRINAGTMQFRKAIPTQAPKMSTQEELPEEATEMEEDRKIAPVNDEYIKKTIQQALSGKNINPVDQKRLRNFLEREDGDFSNYTQAEINRLKGIRKRKLSEEEWDEERVPLKARKTAPPAMKLGGDRGVGVPGSTAEREEKERIRSLKAARNMEAKRHRVVIAKLNTLLQTNTNLLKKDVIKRKSEAEKRMNAEVRSEVLERLREAVPPSPVKAPSHVKETKKKRRSSTKSLEEDTKMPSKVKQQPSEKKVKEEVEKTGMTEQVKESESTEKSYCVCKQPYDPNRFYVGCDACNNWFHGECVGITKKMSKKMTEFICEGCKKRGDQKQEELYCICRQPYDESQFYICCDKCQEWFHGRCIGILAAEASSIDEYNCPNCDPESLINRANFKRLTAYDYELVAKLLKQLIGHKNSGPFRVPVDRREVPNYYNIIKNPMDLQTMSNKLREHKYHHLHEFVRDLTLIFDNCRFFNPRTSKYVKMADSLENFAGSHLQTTRQSMLS